MNKKTITHGLVITVIIAAVFVAAALTPAMSYAKEPVAVATVSSSQADQDDPAEKSGAVMINDNEVPLAEAPFESGINMSWWLIVVSLSAIISAVVIFEEGKDK
ncbi:MAG: hypothetical protein IKO16_01580 [Lachnospiraceae bacterium]|nr:hypothetical protein [Lachnospiraceae bacterium]